MTNETDYTQKELDAVAKTVYAEARGEGERGMRAVAHVIKNRCKSDRWPSASYLQVVYDPLQFSIWNPKTVGKPKDRNFRFIENLNRNHKLFRTCVGICKRVLKGRSPDPTNGADHYHTDEITPPWRDDLLAAGYKTKQIGSHIFYFRE
jgi:spore germination cell wall hydrolase CwlJ-like protein